MCLFTRISPSVAATPRQELLATPLPTSAGGLENIWFYEHLKRNVPPHPLTENAKKIGRECLFFCRGRGIFVISRFVCMAAAAKRPYKRKNAPAKSAMVPKNAAIRHSDGGKQSQKIRSGGNENAATENRTHKNRRGARETNLKKRNGERKAYPQKAPQRKNRVCKKQAKNHYH